MAYYEHVVKRIGELELRLLARQNLTQADCALVMEMGWLARQRATSLPHLAPPIPEDTRRHDKRPPTG